MPIDPNQWSVTPDINQPLNPNEWNITPDPPQPKASESFFSNFFSSPNAARMGLSSAGDIAGGYAAAAFPPLAWATYPTISAIGGAAGEAAGQYLGDEPFNPWMIGTEGLLNPLFPGPNVPGKGAALKEIGQYALGSAKAGAKQGFIGSFPRHVAATGEWELPGIGETAGQTALGYGLGGVLGGTIAGGARLLQGNPRIEPGAGAENVDLTPRPDAPPPPIEAAPPPPPGAAPMTSMDPSVDVSINDPARMAELKAQGYIFVGLNDNNARFVRPDLMHQDAPSEPTTPITETPSTQDPNHISVQQVIQEFGDPVRAVLDGHVEMYNDGAGALGYRRIKPFEPPAMEEPPIESYDEGQISRGETPFGSANEPIRRNETLDSLGFRTTDQVKPLDLSEQLAKSIDAPEPVISEGEVEARYGMPVAQAVQEGLVERVVQNGETGYVVLQGELGLNIGGFRHIGDPRPPTAANETPNPDEIRAYLSRMLGRPATDDEVARAIERQARTGEFTGRVAPFPPPEILAMRQDDLGNVPTQPELPGFLRPGEGERGTFEEFTAEAFDPNVPFEAMPNIREALAGFDEPNMGQQDLPFGPTGSVRPKKSIMDMTMQEADYEGVFSPGGRLTPLPPRTSEGPLPTQPDLPGVVGRTGIAAKPDTIVTPEIKGGVNGPEWYNHPDKIGSITDAEQARQIEKYWHDRFRESRDAGDIVNSDKYADLADLAGERYHYLTDPANRMPRSRDEAITDSNDAFSRAEDLIRDGDVSGADKIVADEVIRLRKGGFPNQAMSLASDWNKFVDDYFVREQGQGKTPKAVVRPMTEYGSKQWGIYVNNELMEGGFFSQKAAKDSARNYGELDTSTPYAELPEGFEDDFSRSFDAWDREQQRPYNQGQLDLPLGRYETGVLRGYEPSMQKPRNELGQFITAAEAAKQQQDIPGLVSRSGVKAKPETIVVPGIRGGSGEGDNPIPPNRIVEINAPRPTDPPVQPPGNVPPDKVPPGSRPPPPDEPPPSVKKSKDKPPPIKSYWEQAYDAVRNLTTGLDISAPMRQGLPLISTKSWWTSWSAMLKAWGSQAAYDANQKTINDHYLFQSYILPDGKRLAGFGQRMGLRLIDELDHVEEVTASKWVEKNLPGFKASNRAYNAYLNKLRADTFTNLIEDAKRLELDPFRNEMLAREIAEFVNTATGAASIKMNVPAWMSKTREVSFEQSAKQLGYLLFSPRQTFSRARMLNPLTYTQATPYVRQQYMRAMIASVGAWGTIASAAAISGYADEVSLDPTSADFGKIRVGKTRLDAGGGFQQYLVATARLLSGTRTTAASAGGRGNTQVLGEGYQARTGLDVAQMFISNKLHPLTKFAYDFLAASEYQPFQTMDKIAQIAIPLYMQDAYEIIMQDRPEILPMLFPAAIGMGTQTYEAGEATSRIVPEKYDFKYTGGERPFSDMWRR